MENILKLGREKPKRKLFIILLLVLGLNIVQAKKEGNSQCEEDMQLEENEHIQGESAQSEAYRHIDDNMHREVQVEGKVEEANLELKSSVKVQAGGKKIQMEEIDTCSMDALSKGPKGKGFFNPCCAYPCENGGVCIPIERDYICICENLEYFGKECHRASWTRWLKNMLFPSEAGHSRLTGLPLFWTLINYIGFLNSLAMSHLYLYSEAMFLSPPTHIATSQDYISMDSYYNRSYYTRDLPPIPQPCPTAMGFEGPIELPPIDTIIEKVLMRENFKVNMQATNVLFVAYAQHFLRQFFKADFKSGIGMTWGEDGVDASQIYGKDEETRRLLRSYKDGKLKVTVIRNEDYPPILSEVPTLYKTYPDGPSEILGHDRRKGTDYKWALGDPLFNTNIWLFVIATVWLREHNRVCTVLQKEHPNWNDERLYQTARLIITGEMIKITMEDYLQHLTQYKLTLKYKPELLHYTNFQYSNRIRQEYNFMHYWQAMEPEEFEFQNRIYDAHNFNFLNNSIVDEHGIDGFMKVMVDTPAGEIGYQNYPHSSFCSLKRMLALSREMRMQSFNNYRKAFGMTPYKNFLDMTGDPESAQTLQELYQDVNAVEFFVGVVTEKKEKSMLGQTTVIMSTSWTIKTLMSNAIGSPGWWKTVTFGGKIGMNIIKKATLRKLICRNLQRKCECSVSFTVPYDKFQAVLKNVYEQQLEKFVPKEKCGLHHNKLQ